jgi:hypothetical protein
MASCSRLVIDYVGLFGQIDWSQQYFFNGVVFDIA